VRILALLLVAPLLGGLSGAQERFHGREIARTMHWSGADWLLRETREDEEHVSRLLQELGVEPGMTVCDLGVGVGVHALPIARLVGPSGRVLGVDVQPEMLARLEERARDAGMANVAGVLGGEADPKLAPGSCDLILLVDVYHELARPAEMLAAVRAALKSDGRVALVEFRAEDPAVPIQPLHKMSKAQILREWESHGFALVAQRDDLPWQHLMFFERDDSPAAAPPQPVGPTPSARQLAWHARELYAFVHFNMNTFTDVEWGEGREPPASFAPSELDCAQWARVAKEAGMSAIILTAKHHDGFCLWNSAFTEHDVANSPWRGGAGDVLAELSAACRDAGLGFGVYLSPWDRNHPTYGTPEYNDVFVGQLTEVLTGYGDVCEVWFDGACGEGPNGRRQEYDWDAFVGAVRALQPDAAIFSDVGPDVRWVGNERGYAAETSWYPFDRAGYAPGMTIPGQTAGHPDGAEWIPPECDVSIRPGWYYHAAEDDDVKSVDELLAIWHGSVGRGANLLLNLPVDRRGLVHANDVAALRGLRARLDELYGEDLARASSAGEDASSVQAHASSPQAHASSTQAHASSTQAHASSIWSADPRYAARAAIDGDPATYWTPAADDPAPHLVVELGAPTRFDRVVLGEHLPLGQRVAAFTVEARVDGAWRAWASATTIGRKRIVIAAPVEADAVRVRCLGKGAPALARLELVRGD
jgi:alpha-L-fucosidase